MNFIVSEDDYEAAIQSLHEVLIEKPPSANAFDVA
jgi:hypothetical protein